MDTKHNEDYYIRVLFDKVKVRDIMNVPVVTICEDDDFSLAEEIFVKNNIYYLPVVNREGKIKGLISHKYLYKTQSPRKMMGAVGEEMAYDPDIVVDGDAFYDRETLNDYILRSVMVNDPFTMRPEDSLSNAVLNLVRRNIGCIPIVDKGSCVVGILTMQNISNYLARILTE